MIQAVLTSDLNNEIQGEWIQPNVELFREAIEEPGASPYADDTTCL